MRKYLQAVGNPSNPIPDEAFVFLGGTCNGSKWREVVIESLKVPYFNPVVDNWTEADRDQEERAKKEASYLLYVLTPKQQGIYSLIEAAVDILQTKDKFVVLAFLPQDEGDAYSEGDWKSVLAAVKLLSDSTENPFAKVCDSVNTAIAFINKSYEGLSGQ